MELKLDLTIHNLDKDALQVARVADALLLLVGKEPTCSADNSLDGAIEALSKSTTNTFLPVNEKMTVETVVTPPVTVHAVPSPSRSAKCSNCGFYGNSCTCDTAEEETVDTANVGFGGAVKPENETLDTANVGFGGSSALVPSSAVVPPPPSVNTLTGSATPPAAPVPPTNVPNAALPGANAPTGAAPTNLAETDKSGLPWDARIHAGNKSKKADGNWKAKRGVDPVLVSQVEAELRGGTVPDTPAVPTPINVIGNEVAEFNSLMQDLGPYLLTETNLQGLSAGELKNFARQLGLIDPATNEGSMKMLVNASNLIPAFRSMVNAHLAQFGQSLGA